MKEGNSIFPIERDMSLLQQKKVCFFLGKRGGVRWRKPILSKVKKVFFHSKRGNVRFFLEITIEKAVICLPN
jgi:hypothetical protein